MKQKERSQEPLVSPNSLRCSSSLCQHNESRKKRLKLWLTNWRRSMATVTPLNNPTWSSSPRNDSWSSTLPPSATPPLSWITKRSNKIATDSVPKKKKKKRSHAPQRSPRPQLFFFIISFSHKLKQPPTPLIRSSLSFPS